MQSNSMLKYPGKTRISKELNIKYTLVIETFYIIFHVHTQNVIAMLMELAVNLIGNYMKTLAAVEYANALTTQTETIVNDARSDFSGIKRILVNLIQAPDVKVVLCQCFTPFCSFAQIYHDILQALNGHTFAFAYIYIHIRPMPYMHTDPRHPQTPKSSAKNPLDSPNSRKIKILFWVLSSKIHFRI